MKKTPRLRFKFYKIISFYLFALLFYQYTFASEYGAEISINETNITKYDFERTMIPVVVKNTGLNKWDSFAEKSPVYLSYHLLSKKDGNMLAHDNIRTSFPQKIFPGETSLINLKLSPHSAGEYVVRVDLVAEGITWFKNQGSKEVDVFLNIVESQKIIEKPKPELEKYNAELLWYIEGEQEINYCSLLSNKVLEENFQKFNFNNVLIYGFVAGAGYPQIWIRDSATIMPISRHTHTKSELMSWIIAHLSIQKKSGELQDWIASNDEFGKNTVETDQESSLVIAAFEISKTIGYDWLLEEVDSRSILLRLHDALRFVFIQRIDSRTGLVKSGHTADWGDVSNEFPDQRALDLHNSSDEVVGIYTNALAYGAATKLSLLFQQAGMNNQSTFWKSRSEKLDRSIRRFLWQEDKGFFRTHKHVTLKKHDHFDEDNIFPMGGNAVAIEMGVTELNQAHGIIRQALLRQKLFNFSTISGVLLPPYPKDFFKHQALNDYFEYQNGGQWDWFGGRLVLQMFHNGHSMALDKLRELCKKSVLNKGFYEWDTMDGKGRGSSHYSGSAATISRMIVEGLFGIDWDYRSIRIKPHFALDNGYIYVPQAANEKFLSYDFKVISTTDEKIVIKFFFGSNVNYQKTLILPISYEEYSYNSINSNGNKPKERIVNNYIEIDLFDGRNEIYIKYQKD